MEKCALKERTPTQVKLIERNINFSRQDGGQEKEEEIQRTKTSRQTISFSMAPPGEGGLGEQRPWVWVLGAVCLCMVQSTLSKPLAWGVAREVHFWWGKGSCVLEIGTSKTATV